MIRKPNVVRTSLSPEDLAAVIKTLDPGSIEDPQKRAMAIRASLGAALIGGTTDPVQRMKPEFQKLQAGLERAVGRPL